MNLSANSVVCSILFNSQRPYSCILFRLSCTKYQPGSSFAGLSFSSVQLNFGKIPNIALPPSVTIYSLYKNTYLHYPQTIVLSAKLYVFPHITCVLTVGSLSCSVQYLGI